MTGYERSDLLINGLGLLANFCALLFIAVQLAEGRRASRKANAEAASENERRARQATLDYYYNTFVVRQELVRKLPSHTEPDEVNAAIAKALSGDYPDLRADIKAYLGYFETLSGGVNLGIYDIATIDRLTGSRIINTFNRWRPYVDAVRDQTGSASLYAEFEALADELGRRRAAVKGART